MRSFGTASRSHAGEIAGAVTLPAAVNAYAKGASFTPVSVSVAAAGVNPVTADLHPSSVPTATVSGSVQFVSSTAWP